MIKQTLRKIVKETCWHFRKVFEGDDAYDPKPFDKFNALSCVLEFIQNALDAIRRNLKKVKINIRTEFVSIETFKKHFLVNNFEVFLSNGNRAAHKEIPQEQRVLCLILEDYNTTGILGDPERFKSKLENGEENSIHQFNHEIGGGRKLTNADFGGSEGEGRQTYCQSSNLSTFFYYTVREDGSEYFMGMHYSGIFEYGGDTYKAFSHFGNLVDSEQDGGKPFVVPISDKEVIGQYKKIFNLKRTEPGTDIIIPFIDASTISLDNIEKVILGKYRVAIAKDELEIKIQNKNIDKSNISQLCSDRINDELGKKITKEYFDFLDDSFKNGLKSNNLSFNPTTPTVINKDQNLSEEILTEYRNNKIIKFNVPFKIYKKQIVEKKITNQIQEIDSSFNIYIKKFSDTSEQFKLNDTIRGNMPIEDIRQLSSNFILTDIQDKEAKLLVKTGEVANHSKIKVKHGKFRNLYKLHSQIPVMTFINNVVKSMQNLFLDDVEDLDEKTTMDLCSIESDLDFDKNKSNQDENIEDEKKDEDKIKKSEDELPRIPGKLKAYRAYPDHGDKGPVWKAIGVKYSKKQISLMKDEALKALEARQEKLKKEKDQLNFIEKQAINKEIVTAGNRLDDLSNFEDRGYTFFPIKIYLSAAFDDGSSDPYTSYCSEDFDFNDSNKFKFKSSGSVSMTKNNENKITYEASSEDFQVTISGFGSESEEKILIRHNYRSLT